MKKKNLEYILLPLRHNYYYSPKTERRNPNFKILTVHYVSNFLNLIKEYDETSGKIPIYPLYSKLFDEKFITEKLEIIESLKGTSYTEADIFTEEESSFMYDVVIPYFWGYSTLDDIGAGDTISNIAYDLSDDPEVIAYYDKWHNRGLSSAIDIGETVYSTLDELVDNQIIDNRVFYTTIKAGETKTVEIPASELLSLAIVEVDYDDTEEFETIYYNQPNAEMIRTGGDKFYMLEAKNEFEYTLTNRGQVVPTKLNITGKKQLTGKDLSDNQFSFVLKEDDAVIDEATCDAQGNISFKEIEYTEEGKHTYTIEEKNDNQAGYEYDTHIETVKVNVTKDDDYNLVATPEYDSDSVIFTNKYSAKGSAKISATKNLTGRDIKDGEFTFELKEGNTLVETVTNKNNKVSFSKLNYDLSDIGTHTYTVSEKKGNSGGVDYDSHTETIKVNVTDNGDGTLTATPVYDADGIVFNNTYSATGKVAISGKKIFNNKSMEEFSFVLKEDDIEIAIVKNSDTGEFAFPEIEYDLKDIGKHIYTITETNDNKPGVTYDEHVETVTVDVTDNGDGTLRVESVFDEDGVVFTNIIDGYGYLKIKKTTYEYMHKFLFNELYLEQ